MVVLTTAQVADVLRRELNVHGSRTRGSGKRLVRVDVKNPANTIWGDPASPAASPQVTKWLDFWYELEQCGRDDWPQLIRLPAPLMDGRRGDGGRDPGVYTREEVAAMLRQVTDFPGPHAETVPLITLEPVGGGVYRITEELSDEPGKQEPSDDAVSVPDDNRQAVFLDSRTLFHAG